MSVITRKTQYLNPHSYAGIIVLSAWGFAMVLTSLLFLWLGYLLDTFLGTTPKFMLGFFILAIVGCFVELYQQIVRILKDA